MLQRMSYTQIMGLPETLFYLSIQNYDCAIPYHCFIQAIFVPRKTLENLLTMFQLIGTFILIKSEKYLYCWNIHI